MKRAVLLCLLALSLSRTAQAHTLDLATARVTQRDGHVEILVEADAVELVKRSVPEAKDAATIATADDRALAAYVDEARRATLAGASLDADGVTVPLLLRAFPTSAQVRFAAAEASSSPGAHPATSTLRFEAKTPVGHARRIAVRLPPTLGRVLYTYVQPETQLADPGGAASFAVLAPPVDAAVARDRHLRTWLAFAAGLFAIVALALQWRRRPAKEIGTGEQPT